MDIIKKRIGIVGGGQLGKMMILEAKRLGFYIVTLDPDESCPSHSISDEHIVAGFNETQAYIELAEKSDVITYEFEHINVRMLEELEEKKHLIYPSVKSLKTIQNKYAQKLALQRGGVPVPRFARADSPGAIKDLGSEGCFGYPLMLKTVLGGYDGKGNALIKDETEVMQAYVSLGGGANELMVEAYIDFEKEISIIASRGADGSRVVYPAAENIHANSILDTTIVPAGISPETLDKAIEIAGKVMEVFDGVGTFCVEMFVTKNDDIFVNEVAPRPHNSGHYTIEGCLCNQFENHIRAIAGLPLGRVGFIGPTVMINLLGDSTGPARLVGLQEAYADPNVHVHFYGKTQSRPARKMGHITVRDDTVEDALRRAAAARALVKATGQLTVDGS